MLRVCDPKLSKRVNFYFFLSFGKSFKAIKEAQTHTTNHYHQRASPTTPPATTSDDERDDEHSTLLLLRVFLFGVDDV
jgi:hypothetical protein